MQSAAWVGLLRRIPPALHDSLVIITSTAAEIVVQNIVRLERDYAVVRGRMAGTQDTGRLVFIPYDQIDFAGLTRILTEPEIQSLLGKPGAGALALEAVEAPTEAAEEGTVEPVDLLGESTDLGKEPEDALAEHLDPAPPATAPPKLGHPSKSILLARLRARLTGENAKPPQP